MHESRGLLQVPLPAWLASIGARMAQRSAVYGVNSDGGPLAPNHVLVNAYGPGQGIMVSGSTTVTAVRGCIRKDRSKGICILGGGVLLRVCTSAASANYSCMRTHLEGMIVGICLGLAPCRPPIPGKVPSWPLMHASALQAHQDGPAYYPGVCILSLAAPAVMRFRRKPSDDSVVESGAWWHR